VVPRDYAAAAHWYRRAADQDCAPAQCNLGLCYQIGRGVAKNTAEAVRWFCLAAKQGDKTAQYNLGLHYAQTEAASAGNDGGQPSI
jgi:TPR repeat protein